MPSISEIIAAKAARAAAERAPEVAPGKPRGSGLVLNSAPLPKPPEPPAPPEAPEPRSLSRPAGETIPMVPTRAEKEEATWHEALNSFESQLCAMRDPLDPETIWLAVRPNRAGLPPILLHRLPWALWEHPATVRKEDEPF
jgi:hypothetical protein